MEQNLDKSLVRKNRRWGEWLIEKSVALIASLSIILICIIFIFVFREAMPLFSSMTLEEPAVEVSAEPAETESGDDLRPEIYNPEVYNLGPASESSGEMAPESYDPNAPEQYDPNAPEQYDPNAPESYDPNAPEPYEPKAPEQYEPNAPDA